MNYEHKNLASGRWNTLSLMEQMANVGSEIERTILWRKKGDKKYSQKAFFRTLELLDLTLSDPKNKGHLKEIARVRETLCDFFVGENEFKSTDKSWQKYFYSFNYAARAKL